MADRTWQHLSSTGETTPTTITPHFTLTAPPKTDVWRPSPSEDHFNAPFTYTVLPTQTFHSLAVTVSANWKTLYDQGGLLLLFPSSSPSQPSKWIKTGLEFFSGAPALSVVGNDRYSDWSLCPLPMVGMTHATIECERKGETLWVYFVFNGEKRVLREVKWAFLEEREKGGEMWVGVYAAKPTPEAGGDGREGIEVVFRDLKLKTV